MPSQRLLQLYRTLRYRTPMRAPADVAARAVLATAGHVLTRPHDRRLFLVGHMRSGSSLLSNILCSSDEINGYGESKVVLRSPRDLAVLRGKIAMVQFLNGQRPVRRSRYLFDKILHSRLLPRSAVLEQQTSRTIFLLRPPERTLPSIVASFGWNIEQATNYLRDQYPFIEHLARTLPPETDAVVVEHADVIEHTETVLDSLGDWLDLHDPLSAEYNPRHVARITGSGDTSDRINAGRVIRESRSHAVDLSGVDLKELDALYHRAVGTLRDRFPDWTAVTHHPFTPGSSR